MGGGSKASTRSQDASTTGAAMDPVARRWLVDGGLAPGEHVRRGPRSHGAAHVDEGATLS